MRRDALWIRTMPIGLMYALLAVHRSSSSSLHTSRNQICTSREVLSSSNISKVVTPAAMVLLKVLISSSSSPLAMLPATTISREVPLPMQQLEVFHSKDMPTEVLLEET